MIPDDEALVHEGIEAATARPGRVRLIACGALAREILALIRLNGWEHLELSCLPALLHNRPDRIPEAVRMRIHAARAEGVARIFVVYADCGTGGLLDTVCAEEGVERVPGPHCYAFFDGLETFDARAGDEIGAFYLTDFLARQFDALVWRGLGLDRHPELREAYFGHYDRVVHLAQTEDPALTAAARAAAERLGLAFERRFTGYGDLAAALAGLRPG
ncbi:MAG: DUF1638 domain-containing protein [Alphaproteobacteria bacterium]|nr:MAG: DUF1638 domain-containing protein [Alphaproteobacteria bacterium]